MERILDGTHDGAGAGLGHRGALEFPKYLRNTDLYPSKMAAILKARDEFKENGHSGSVEVAGPAPEILVDHAEVLDQGGGFWG